jgi:hypothetical protein
MFGREPGRNPIVSEDITQDAGGQTHVDEQQGKPLVV